MIAFPKKLIQNAFYVPSIDKYFCSWGTHDFVGHVFPDKREYYIDGGLSYSRVVGDFISLREDGSIVDFSLYDTSPESEIYEKLLMYHKGSNKYKPLREFSKKELFQLIEILATKKHPFHSSVQKTSLYWFNK